MPGVLRGRRILVVDDDPAVLEGTAAVLEALGLRVHAASSPTEAEERVRRGAAAPDALLVDDDLGGPLRGPEVVARLRALAARDLPAAVVTAGTDPERLEAIRRAGLPLLRKPARPARLRALLASLFRDPPGP